MSKGQFIDYIHMLQKSAQNFTSRDLLSQHFRRGPHRDIDLKFLWDNAAVLPEEYIKKTDKRVVLE